MIENSRIRKTGVLYLVSFIDEYLKMMVAMNGLHEEIIDYYLDYGKEKAKYVGKYYILDANNILSSSEASTSE